MTVDLPTDSDRQIPSLPDAVTGKSRASRPTLRVTEMSLTEDQPAPIKT